MKSLPNRVFDSILDENDKISNEQLIQSIKEYKTYKNDLLEIEYVTIFEYLDQLELISKCIKESEIPSVTYLAAAVSDFYLP